MSMSMPTRSGTDVQGIPEAYTKITDLLKRGQKETIASSAFQAVVSVDLMMSDGRSRFVTSCTLEANEDVRKVVDDILNLLKEEMWTLQGRTRFRLRIGLLSAIVILTARNTNSEVDFDDFDRFEDEEKITSPRLRISERSKELLDRLTEIGIYGRTPEEIASRFVDERLQRLVETGVLTLDEEGSGA